MTEAELAYIQWVEFEIEKQARGDYGPGLQRETELRPELAAESRKKRQAHWTVRQAIKRGELPLPSTQKCVDCGQPAHHYHHGSYATEDWLKVKPICRSCHSKRHPRRSKAKIRQEDWQKAGQGDGKPWYSNEEADLIQR